MSRLASLWKSDPGLVVSGGAHVGLLAFLLWNFTFPPKLEEPAESVAVELVTTSELNQIMNGEEKAKQLPKPQRRVDKVAALEERSPAPPLAEAKKDTPPPPLPEKAAEDPGQAEKTIEATSPTPPPPTPAPPQPPARPVAKVDPPPPPERPIVKAETPPPKPDPVKPPPPEAETLEPTPPPRPKTETKQAKKEQKPVKVAKVVPPEPPERPDPPRPPEPKPVPKPEPKKPVFDQVAKLLDTLKPAKPEQRARAGNEAKDHPHNDFSLDKITALLDHEAPQHKGSSGKQLTQLASLGAPNAHAEKMSPSMVAQLDGWLIDHYRGCWNYFGLGSTQDYVPEVRVKMAQDGSLIGQPQLLNPTSDPNLRSLAESALRAVNRCNPMAIPERFKPFYDNWRQRVVRFDPKQMS